MILSRRKFIALVGSAAAVAALPKLPLERKGAIDEKGLYVREWSGGRVRFQPSKNYEQIVMPSWQPKSYEDMRVLVDQLVGYGYYFVAVIDEGHPDRESCCMIVGGGVARWVDFTDPAWRA
jgi:hypothetical protein